MLAFAIGIALSTVVGRLAPEVMPWSNDLPPGTQTALRMLAGVVVSFLLFAAWWMVRRTTRHV
jgi:hypothetical protein